MTNKRTEPKKTVKTKVVEDKEAKIIEDAAGNQHIVVLEQKTYYSFTNLRPGMFFFKKDDGTELQSVMHVCDRHNIIFQEFMNEQGEYQ